MDQVQPIVWKNNRTVQLIKAYEAHGLLWNQNLQGYNIRNVRIKAWESIANIMGLSVQEVKKKMNSLIAVFRHQHRKGVANPRWWAHHMAFLISSRNNQLSANNSNNSREVSEDGSELEFLSENQRKRNFQSAYSEFRSEFETPKRLIVVDKHNTTRITLNGDDNAVLSEVRESPQTVIPDDSSSPTTDDSDDIPLYVRYIECKLKKFSPHIRNIVQFEINRLIYKADMGQLDKIYSADCQNYLT